MGRRCGKIPAALWLWTSCLMLRLGFLGLRGISQAQPRAALPQVTLGNCSGIHTQWAAAQLPATGTTRHRALGLCIGEGGDKQESGVGSFPEVPQGTSPSPSVWD